MATDEDENVIEMNVSVHALEHPKLYSNLIIIRNEQLRSRQLKDLASNSIKSTENSESIKTTESKSSINLNAAIDKNLSESLNDTFTMNITDINLTSILKFMFGVISGTGIACAFIINALFFIIFALGLVGYASIIENERAKKNPPT